MSEAKKTSYNLVAILIAITSTCTLGTRPLVALFGNELNASTIEIGLIISMFPLLPFFFAIQIGRLVDKIGCKKPLMIGGILLGISLTIPFFVSSLLGLFLSQLFAGFGHTFSIVAGQSYMGHADHPLTRENNVLKFSIATSLGNFLGPLMGGYLSDTLGTPKVFLIFGLLSSCSLFLAALVSDLGKSTVSNASAWKIWQSLELLKNANFRRALMISSLILFAKDTFTAYFPLFGVEIGLTGTQIGTIISINSIAGILVRLFTPKLLALFGRTRVTMGTIFITGLFLILVPLSKEFIVSCFFSFALGAAFWTQR